MRVWGIRNGVKALSVGPRFARFLLLPHFSSPHPHMGGTSYGPVWHRILFEEPNLTGSRPRYGTGILFEEPNPTGSRPKVLKIPRGDRNGVGEDEVTVTSGLHAQVERTKKQTERRELQTRVPSFFSPRLISLKKYKMPPFCLSRRPLPGVPPHLLSLSNVTT